VREYESAGVAAIQLEDQAFPKKCGHLPDKELISADEFVLKLRAALDARTDPDLLVIARTTPAHDGVTAVVPGRR
jgi:2-methylisocitrate lyase-like PEP mutase family enzyme